MGAGLLHFPLTQYSKSHERSLVHRMVSSDPTSAVMDQCLRLHGPRAHGLQFHFLCKNLTRQGMEIRSHFRPTRYLVCLNLLFVVLLTIQIADK